VNVAVVFGGTVERDFRDFTGCWRERESEIDGCKLPKRGVVTANDTSARAAD
jgi:hypothetical protein